MGDIYRLTLDYKAGAQAGPGSVVVKLPSSHEENRAQGVALGMFVAEVTFYNQLAPRISVGMPDIYLAAVAEDGADFVIVMEDLSALSMVDQSTGMNVEQARAAVEVLAGVHAAFWNDADRPDLEWIPTMTGPRIEFVDGLMAEIFPVFAEHFGDALPAGGLALYEQFIGNYLKIMKVICARSPWTIAHQDYRIENLLFGPPGSHQVVVLDWQGLGRGVGAYDLAYVLGGSMSSELRRQHERELVAAYHEALLTAGVNGYGLDSVWEDYAHAQLMGGLAVSIVTGGSMDLSNERARELIATMARRHVQAALDHDGPARLAEITG
jgi:aminoglycoside/choline kinase family phosphotransferase